MTNHTSPHRWFTLFHCGCFLADPDAIVISELIESNRIQLIFTIDISTIRVFSTGVCMCVCVCVCV